ncbi:hypothetical protein BDZ89DRAFT_1055643 [Hymenopellis radicata]|nr:hypothetical protein BDZ89DRAFT_1055643 [Hymenopellis radicata]
MSSFLFQLLDSKQRLSCRKIHICRLYDILHLSLLKNDLPRARQVWSILARCKEINWISLWPTAVRVLGDETFDMYDSTRKLEFLHEMLVEYPEQREGILKEIILRQILAGKYREALDKLELYLPSFPYQDDPVLHTYAGLLCLYLSQPSDDDMGDGTLDPSLLNSARAHLEGAKSVDPRNQVAIHFLDQITELECQETPAPSESDSDDAMDVLETPSRKRQRT